jgi:hypothetical protein
MTQNQHPDPGINPVGRVVSLYLRGTITLVAIGVMLLIVGAAVQKRSLVVVSMFLTALALIPLALFGLADRAPRRQPSSPRYEELDAVDILPVLSQLDPEELEVLRDHEASHQARPAIMSKINELLDR